MKDIRDQSMWLTRTMENILSMTKIESGADFISRKEEVLEDLVYEAERHVSGLKDSRKFEQTMPEEVLTANVDARLMVQVLVNLLDNAVKNTAEGGSIWLRVYYRNGRAYFVIEGQRTGDRAGAGTGDLRRICLAGRTGAGPEARHGAWACHMQAGG